MIRIVTKQGKEFELVNIDNSNIVDYLTDLDKGTWVLCQKSNKAIRIEDISSIAITPDDS